MVPGHPRPTHVAPKQLRRSHPVILEPRLGDEVWLLVYPILLGRGKRFVLNGQIIPSVTVWERVAMALEVPLVTLLYERGGRSAPWKQRKICQVHPRNCLKPRPELKHSQK
jgi:hypothetical protein